MPAPRKPRKPAAPKEKKPGLRALEREWRAATTEARDLRVRLLRASADAERWQAEAERWRAEADALAKAFEKMRQEAAEAKAALRARPL